MRIVIFILAAVFIAGGCAQLKQNPDPIPDIDVYTTRELLDMRESCVSALGNYKGLPNDMTNKKTLTTLRDETAGIKKRKLAQIERELKRRYTGGEAGAYYPGVDGKAVPAQPVSGEAAPVDAGKVAPTATP